MTGFSDEFRELWDTKVKAQIAKCTPECETIANIQRGFYTVEEATRLLREIKAKGYKDVYGQFCIGELIWVVEHALADDRQDLNFIQHFYQVHGCLNDEGYWTNVHKNDLTTEESKNLLILRDLINEMYKLLEK